MFEGLKCADIRTPTAGELEEADFVIEMPFDLWKAMVANVQSHGEADLQYTLNSLDLRQEKASPIRPPTIKHVARICSTCHNENLQDLFDASARVKTTFA